MPPGEGSRLRGSTNHSRVGIAALAALLAVHPVHGQAPQGLETIQIHPNLYMIAGAGANITVQTGADGTVLVDSGTTQAADAVLAILGKITHQPVRYIIDTSADADAIGGSGALAKAGRDIYWTGTAPRATATQTNGFIATILAPDSLLLKVSAPTGGIAAYPRDAWPGEAFDAAHKYIYFNHEAIDVYRQAAHDDTDSIVLFRASDVISAGDVIDADHFPRIDVSQGGSIDGEIDALNHILALSDRPIPFVYQPGGTYIVPGHGRIYQQADVVQYRDMLVIVRTIIANMIQRGMTLPQIEKAAPCLAYQSEYGTDSGSWTTDDFIQAVYRSLRGRKPRRGKS
jgi:cyclase